MKYNIGALFIVITLLTLIAGWISNIVQVIMMAQEAGWDEVSIMLVLKVIGIFAAPLGAILGIVGWF